MLHSSLHYSEDLKRVIGPVQTNRDAADVGDGNAAEIQLNTAVASVMIRRLIPDVNQLHPINKFLLVRPRDAEQEKADRRYGT
jgi:hypothetical protein